MFSLTLLYLGGGGEALSVTFLQDRLTIYLIDLNIKYTFFINFLKNVTLSPPPASSEVNKVFSFLRTWERVKNFLPIVVIFGKKPHEY